MTYRQEGMISGKPLDVLTGTITADECNVWDKHFKIIRSDVEEFVARYIPTGGSDPTYDQAMIPESIRDWGLLLNGNSPSTRSIFRLHSLIKETCYYEPLQGDYPDYNITGDNDEAELYGDQTLWWMFNDKGNIHTETEADPIGLENSCRSIWIYVFDNEINDMTFYNYKIINRSHTSIIRCVFWSMGRSRFRILFR